MGCVLHPESNKQLGMSLMIHKHGLEKIQSRVIELGLLSLALPLKGGGEHSRDIKDDIFGRKCN